MTSIGFPGVASAWAMYLFVTIIRVFFSPVPVPAMTTTKNMGICGYTRWYPVTRTKLTKFAMQTSHESLDVVPVAHVCTVYSMFCLLDLHSHILESILVTTGWRICLVKMVCRQLRQVADIAQTHPLYYELYKDARRTIICSGCYHDVIVTPDGQLVTFGRNTYGQLGNEEVKHYQSVPGIVPDASSVIVGAGCGHIHTVVVTVDGEVFTCGYGDVGQLGHGELNNERKLQMVQALSNVHAVHVAAGTSHTVVLTDTGAVYVFGAIFGWHGYKEIVSVPRMMEWGLDRVKVVGVAAGAFHTVVFTVDGTVFTCGDNAHGQLGHGEKVSKVDPQIVPGLLGKTVVGLAAGKYHTAVFTDKGNVFTFGDNEYGQLGHGDNESKLDPRMVKEGISDVGVVGVAAGGYHTVLLTNYGKVFTCGCNNQDQLGFASNPRKNNTVTVPRVVNIDAVVVKVFAGLYHTALLTDSNKGLMVKYLGCKLAYVGCDVNEYKI